MKIVKVKAYLNDHLKPKNYKGDNYFTELITLNKYKNSQ